MSLFAPSLAPSGDSKAAAPSPQPSPRTAFGVKSDRAFGAMRVLDPVLRRACSGVLRTDSETDARHALDASLMAVSWFQPAADVSAGE